MSEPANRPLEITKDQMTFPDPQPSDMDKTEMNAEQEEIENSDISEAIMSEPNNRPLEITKDQMTFPEPHPSDMDKTEINAEQEEIENSDISEAIMSEPAYVTLELKEQGTPPRLQPQDKDISEINAGQVVNILSHKEQHMSKTKSSDILSDVPDHETSDSNMKNSDQLVPEINDQSMPETSNYYKNNSDQQVPEINDQFMSELSIDDTEHLSQITHDDLQFSDHLVHQTSHVDMKENIDQIVCGVSNIDIDNNEQPEPESAASVSIDDLSGSNFKRNNDHSKTSTIEIKSDGQSSHGTSDSYWRNSDQEKLESSEKRNEINDGCILNKKSIQEFQGGGDSFSLLSKNEAPLLGKYRSSSSSQTYNVYPTLSSDTSFHNAENFINKGTPFIPTTSSPSKLYPDITDLQKDIEPTSVRHRANKPSLMTDTYGNSSASSDVEGPMFTKLIKPLLVVLGLVLIAAIVYWLLFALSSPSDKFADHINKTQLQFPNHDKFADHLNNMQKHFPSQSLRFWRTVKASTTSIFRDVTSKHPAILIMASSTLHAAVTLCIAKQISSGFESSWGLSPNMSLVDINHLEHLDAAEQKMQLDNILDSAFSIHKRKSFIIDNLQVLKPSTALLFYRYCDNDNAPYKDVMILFTLYYDEKEGKMDTSSAVENYLEKMWSRDLSVDKVKPLMSRVANNIVIISGENSATLGDVCS